MSDGYGRIYGLTEPGTGELRYVGATWLPIEMRRDQHWTNPTSQASRQWMEGLRGLGLKPGVVLIEEASETLLRDREKYWIERKRAEGANLLNDRPGRKPGQYKIYPHQLLIRLTDAGWKRWEGIVEARLVLQPGEAQADILRDLVEREADRLGVPPSPADQ